ncbi:unnamed protein product [Cuscuta campestris]|uniref:Autophagy-related protein 13 N-terminal domain-containing protein n=1 Tax=Cuscuta campestris TaxID=132261 RepID=A0A484KCI1_9ASTE|nr:unnamed protein product [Cuscuta campestris]
MYSNKHSEQAKVEQIITEFFPKSLHVILESRCPYASSRNYSGEQCVSSPSSSSSSTSSVRPRDKWFNLALKDCAAALENIDFWRQSNLDPMIVDVVLLERPNARSFSKEKDWISERDEFSGKAKEKIVERWMIQYEGRDSKKRSSSCTSSQIVYKNIVLLLRSLYVTARILPGYKFYRDLTSSAQIRTYNLCSRVSSFAEPFTHRQEAEMQQFVFTPVETSCGRLCISVWYCSSISDVSSEPSTPLSPQFIPDYVGNPMAEPLKQFPSGPIPQSLYPLERRHSWSYDLYRASPPPSPTYSEPQASINQTRATCLPPPTSRPQVHTKNTSFDEYWPSPTISTSPSLSPSPTYAPTGVSGIGKALLRFGSAPVRIPDSRLLGVPFRFYNQLLAPSPPLKGVRPTSAKTDKSSSLAAKSFSPGKDDGDKLCMVKVTQTNISPQKSFSRSSSRLSYQDEYEDSEFSGPFVVDDDDGDMTDHGNRSFCRLGRAGPKPAGNHAGRAQASIVRPVIRAGSGSGLGNSRKVVSWPGPKPGPARTLIRSTQK